MKLVMIIHGCYFQLDQIHLQFLHKICSNLHFVWTSRLSIEFSDAVLENLKWLCTRVIGNRIVNPPNDQLHSCRNLICLTRSGVMLLREMSVLQGHAGNKTCSRKPAWELCQWKGATRSKTVLLQRPRKAQFSYHANQYGYSALVTNSFCLSRSPEQYEVVLHCGS